jgi:hypothetical protein
VLSREARTESDLMGLSGFLAQNRPSWMDSGECAKDFSLLILGEVVEVWV